MILIIIANKINEKYPSKNRKFALNFPNIFMNSYNKGIKLIIKLVKKTNLIGTTNIPKWLQILKN